jgi:hypothetical protein
MGRLRALLHSELHAQQPDATRNATGNGGVLHVALPRECNTQQPAANPVRELDLLIAALGPIYSIPAEQFAVIRKAAVADLPAALECFRSLAARAGLTIH